MKKNIVLFAALVGLAACVTPDKMYYEVVERGRDSVAIQANIGNMGRHSDMVNGIRAKIDEMARAECQGDAEFTGESIRTAGPYHTWLERLYGCR